jgi:hypothetical protein
MLIYFLVPSLKIGGVAVTKLTDTPTKQRPTCPHLPWRTQAPPSRAPRTTVEKLSTAPPRLIIYSSRVRLEPDLPHTRLAVHNSDRFHSVLDLHATFLIPYAT